MSLTKSMINSTPNLDVCLVEMPYSAFNGPSLALSLMKGCLLADGQTAEIVYANLLFNQQAYHPERSKFNAIFFASQAPLPGDAVFAPAAHGLDTAEFMAAYRRAIVAGSSIYSNPDAYWLFDFIEHQQAAVPAFLDGLAVRILAKKPRIVGLSSLFFQDNACFAIARELKKRSPETVIVMGGTNCLAAAGAAIVSHVPSIDCVFSGEADECFAELCRLLAVYGADIPLEKLPYGALTKKSVEHLKAKNLPIPVRQTRNLDAMPYPDFADYFAALKDVGLDKDLSPHLLAEFSRGCWWHAKSPCTFCGLNPFGDTYRVKSPDRAVEEITYLSERYGVKKIELTDNILSKAHLTETLPRLAAQNKDYHLFAEIKSNISCRELENLAAVGVHFVQPGIESLQDDILQEMNKGNRAIKHIELLKRLNELGIHAAWHLLGGFPHEKEASYAELAKTISYITHLEPPGHFTHIIYNTYSAYCNDPAAYGLDLIPLPQYHTVFPLGDDFVKAVAMMFCSRDKKIRLGERDISTKSPSHAAASRAVIHWKTSWNGPRDRLEYVLSADGKTIDITDLREASMAEENFYELTGLNKDIFLRCEGVIRRETVATEFLEKGYDAAAIDAAIDDLTKRRKLIIEIRGELLTLAINSATKKDYQPAANMPMRA